MWNESHWRNPPKDPVTKHVKSTHGMCACGELRPCHCGDFCPTCLSDISEEGGQLHCTKCKVELRVRKS